MLINHVALISQTRQVGFSEVSMISAALQKQITRDFSPIWGVRATIDSFQKLEDVPAGYWPIIIRDDIGYSGAAGIHLDKDGQPYSLVMASNDTSLTCSHELLEMLADPFGVRLIASQSAKPGQGRVKFLVEVCDPSEASTYAYHINGILVSDFYTPHFFDPVKNASVQYSYTGAIKTPRQVLPGGYLSWMVPETGEWWQARYFGSKIQYVSLGRLSRQGGQGWREVIDAISWEPVSKVAKVKSLKKATDYAKAFRTQAVVSSSEGWAKSLSREIEAITSKHN